MLDRDGRSELHYAALNNEADRVVELIAGGEDVDLPDKAGFTPLHFAAQEQALEAAEALLIHGAQVDPADKWGNTPLWRATFSSRGEGDLIRLLRQHGADPLLPNDSGSSPVDLARTIANYPIAQFFEDVP